MGSSGFIEQGGTFDMRSLAQFVDSTSAVTINLVRDEKECIFMQNKLMLDNQRVEAKRQQTLTVLFALLFVFAIAGSLAFFYIRNRREKLLAVEEALETLQQMASIANDETPTETLLVWKDLYPIIDTVYDNFHTRLLALSAGRLSEKELQLCCLLRADFSTKEISVVTQQSVRTIYQRKTNIRHALGMNEKDDIASFIEYSGISSPSVVPPTDTI